MKLLYANDLPGEHAPSWYAATSNNDPPRASLLGNESADVCIVGAGFTGLSAALELCRRGKSVVVLDAHRVGWGASGRNGGQLGSGFNMDQLALERTLGKERAQVLWGIAQGGKKWIQSLCKEQQLDIEYEPGIVHAMHRSRFVNELHRYCDHLAKHYRYTDMQPLSKDQIRQRIDSKAYFGGAIDHGAAHIHSLKLTHGMAEAAEKHGARIFELSEVLQLHGRSSPLQNRVVCADGSVQCQHIIIATNGYLDALYPPLQKWLMPINNFIMVTEPLGDDASRLLPFNEAVADSRFVVNYFRRVSGNRLLFGGGENYRYRFPDQIGPAVRKALLKVFPQLKDARIDHAWGGTLAITRNRLPIVARLEPGIYCAGGYSGHGVGLACASGAAIAGKIIGDPHDFSVLSSLPMKTFPGGTRFRPALLATAMTTFALLDTI